MNCQYRKQIGLNVNICSIGLYGGRPSNGVCDFCIKNGKNKQPKNIPEVSFTGERCCSSNYPSIKKMASTFTKALTSEAKAILNKEEAVTEEMAEKRIATCNSCEFLVKESQRCVKCGCFMKLKVKMRSQHCPIGKW